MRRAAMVVGHKARSLPRTVALRLCAVAMVACSLAFLVSPPTYAGTINLVLRPQQITTNPPIGVEGDYPAGWGSGSWMANGSTVTEVYLTPELLFSKSIKIEDIKSVSFWTKKNTTHTQSAPDWFFTIYTTPFAGSWYGYRINAELYFSENLNDPANQWNLWSSDQGNNWLRFFVSGKSGQFVSNGSYNDPHLDAFKLLPSERGSNLTMANEPIKYFRMSTATGWANGFFGQLDGLTIELTDGSIARVNFEPVPEPTSLVALGGLGLVGAGWRVIRRRKAQST
jgi:hypothetical protein